ncbi:hypothetical protein HMPREF9946_04117 [Acetobacteraceae bacterium AT-5844]|nr:hypothetical protein HMPREF9946_04117 [Acetobacteraceae bacterium AT-5844]
MRKSWREKEFSLQATLIFFFEFQIGTLAPNGDARSANPDFLKGQAG